MPRAPKNPTEVLPPPTVTSEQQMTPTEIIEEGERQYRAAGGNQPTFIDVNPQGRFSQAAGGRVHRVEFSNFDEVAIQDAVRKEAGPGLYVLTLRAAQTPGHLARVPNFEVRPGPVAPAPMEQFGRSNAPANNQPGWNDFLTIMQAQNANMIEVMKAFAGGSRGGGGGPSLVELMALMPKSPSMTEQLQTLIGLQGLFSKMGKGAPLAAVAEGDDGGGILELGIKAFLAAMDKKSEPKPAQQPQLQGATAPPATAAAMPPPKQPDAPQVAASSPEDFAAATAWRTVGEILTVFAGKDASETAAALDPFLGALKFNFEMMGKVVRIDGWEALQNPEEVGKKVVEAFPQLTAHADWLKLVIGELVELNKEDDNGGGL